MGESDKLDKSLSVVMGMVMALVMFAAVAQIAQAAVPQPQYTCPICGEKFFTYDELYNHFIISHPTEPITAIAIWVYSDVTGSVDGNLLSLSATISNIADILITRSVTLYWSILPDYPEEHPTIPKVIALAGKVSGTFIFEVELWAAPPPGRTVVLWLRDDEGYESPRVQISV